MNKKMSPKFAPFLVMGVIITFCALFIVPSFFVTIIDAGEVGVQSTFGKVSDEPMYSGIQLKNPFARIIKMSIRTEEYTMSAAYTEGERVGDDSIEVRAKDGALVYMDVTVFYRLEATSAPKVYKELGVDFEEKIIRPEIRSTIRNVAAQYTVNEIYSTKRDEIAVKIKEELISNLETRGIVVEDGLIRDIKLSDTLAASIEDKLTAQQEAQKLDFLLEKERKEAERKVIEAEGQRDAQRIINESLSNKYLYYLYVTGIKDREGTIYVPTEGGVPLFKEITE